jgi:hypothetical protein
LASEGLGLFIHQLEKALSFVHAPSRGMAVASALFAVMTIQTALLLPPIVAKQELNSAIARLSPLGPGRWQPFRRGDLCWFTAFSLTLVAMSEPWPSGIRAGVLLSIMAFHERVGRREIRASPPRGRGEPGGALRKTSD